MDNTKISWVNEKAYELVVTLRLNNKGKFDSRSKIKSLREYLPKQGEQDITDFVKNATYSLLRGKAATTEFLQALLKIINEMNSYSAADKIELLGYLIGYVSMTLDSVENLYNAEPKVFEQNINQMLEAEFGEKKEELTKKIAKIAKPEQYSRGGR